jgi:DNA-binding MarR family transcriptional regulator
MDDASPASGATADSLALLEALLRASGNLRARLAVLASSVDLNVTELLIIRQCAAASPGISQRELAAALSVSPAQISSVVERLRSRGLIEARRPVEDRRRQVWRLTVPGRRTFGQVLPGLVKATAGLFAGLPPTAIDLLGKSLRQLNSAATATNQLAVGPPDEEDMRGAA